MRRRCEGDLPKKGRGWDRRFHRRDDARSRLVRSRPRAGCVRARATSPRVAAFCELTAIYRNVMSVDRPRGLCSASSPCTFMQLSRHNCHVVLRAHRVLRHDVARARRRRRRRELRGGGLLVQVATTYVAHHQGSPGRASPLLRRNARGGGLLARSSAWCDDPAASDRTTCEAASSAWWTSCHCDAQATCEAAGASWQSRWDPESCGKTRAS